MMSLGASFSCIPAGIIRDRFGSKILVMIYSIPSLIGWMLLTFSINAWMLIMGRFLIGMAGGGYAFLVPIYIGEIASKEIRGTLLSIYEITVKMGVLFIYVLASTINLQIANVICASIVVAYFVIFTILPESPIYLMQKGKIKRAKASLKVLRGNLNEDDYEMLGCKQEGQTKSETLFDQMKDKATRRAFFIISILFIFFQACGINAVLFYLTTIFIETGNKFDPFTSTMILGLVQVLGVLLTVVLVDRCGRKILMILSFAVMIIGHIGIGVFFHFKTQGVTIFEWIPLISLNIFFIGFSIGVGSVTYILLGELFSVSAKKIIAPMAQTINFLTSFAVTLTFPLISSVIGIYLMFYAFALFCFFGIIFVIIYLPETKKKSLNEIQQLLTNQHI